MKVECCYRLLPNAEIIHSKYDSDNRSIDGLDTDWFDVRSIILPEYSSENYKDKQGNYDEMCESILMDDIQNAIVIEDNGIGFYIVRFGGIFMFLDSPTDNRESYVDCISPNKSLYKAIGFRVTKPIQFRTFDGIYRLIVNKQNGLCYTNDGILTPEFDIDSLSKVDFHYSGYKEAVFNGYYAVVYLNGQPVFLRKTDDDRLIII